MPARTHASTIRPTHLASPSLSRLPAGVRADVGTAAAVCNQGGRRTRHPTLPPHHPARDEGGEAAAAGRVAARRAAGRSGGGG
eukprot:3300637-Prymnesium_polylepis.2